MSGGFRSRTRRGDEQKNSPRGEKQNQARMGGPARLSRPPQKNRQPERARSVPGLDAPRLLAHEVLGRVRQDAAYANLILPKALRQWKITERDAAFTTEITYGTLRTMGVLDAVIADCSSRPLEQIAPEVLDALRLGAYQLLYTRVEPHAAVDTTVRLV